MRLQSVVLMRYAHLLFSMHLYSVAERLATHLSFHIFNRNCEFIQAPTRGMQYNTGADYDEDPVEFDKIALSKRTLMGLKDGGFETMTRIQVTSIQLLYMDKYKQTALMSLLFAHTHNTTTGCKYSSCNSRKRYSWSCKNWQW
jgi:hypothetical protein